MDIDRQIRRDIAMERFRRLGRRGLFLVALGVILWKCVLGCAHAPPVPIAEPVTVTMTVDVHVVPGAAWMPSGCQQIAHAKRGRLLGCADRSPGNPWRYEVYVVGYHGQRGIVVEDWVLGHEIWHLLNWRDSRFADPDGVVK